MSHKRAALLAGIGLGKTACALRAIQTLQVCYNLARRVLVVAPLRVARLTWPNEIAEFAPELRWEIFQGRRVPPIQAQSGPDITCTNYEQLPNLRHMYQHVPLPFDLVIFDELTAAKNHNSKRINCIRRRLPDWRWGLTGTPAPNSPMELFAQIRLLDDGKRLGPAFHNFRDTYFEAKDYMEYDWQPKPGAEARIYGRISDMALSLPTVQNIDTIDVEVPLPDEAREVYQELSRELIHSMGRDDNPVVAVNAATLVGKLIQLTGGHLYRADRAVVRAHTAKLDALERLAVAHRSAGRPLLIGANYLHERDSILKRLPWARTVDQLGPSWLAQWSAKKVPALLAHPKTLGHGLNMQYGGHDIVWYSVPHSRELYDQLNGRLDRSGQKYRVTVRRILCPGTVDDAVVETLRQRGNTQRELMNTLVNYRRLLS